MITVEHPQVILLLLPAFAVTVFAWHTGHANLTPWRRGIALLVRVTMLTAIVLGLSGLSGGRSETRQAAVIVADRSASVAQNQTGMQAFINSASALRPADNRVGVVSTGSDSVVEQPMSPSSSFDGFQTTIDAGATNLERGLELAASVLPDGYRRRVVLLSDGQQTTGDAVLAARFLRSRNIRVDVVPQRVRGGPDVMVDRVSMPAEIRKGERSSVLVQLRSTVDTSAQLDVYRDRNLIASRQEHVVVGLTRYFFPQPPLAQGFHTYRVHITPRIDSQPANNTGSAFTLVGGPPRVLILAAVPSEGSNILSGLRSTGIAADLRTPGAVTPSLGSLQRYSAVVVVDTPAESLGHPLMAELVPYVRDLGRGLVVIGGQRAYGLGGYGRTPLETALPVKMDLPKRPDLPSVGVALVVESLEANLPINVSKEAAKGVIHLLTEDDRVAVYDAPDDSSSGWIVRIRPARDKAAIDRAVNGMRPGDPQSYVPSLRAAFNALSSSPTRLKHIILLGDGDARDSQYTQLARLMRRRGTTISTVVTNALDAGDRQTMRSIARAGGGRYYEAQNVNNIPKIFLHEARTVARSGIVTGTFTPRAVSFSPILRGLHALPALQGYVATTPKPRAETILSSSKLDPVLAGWQFGLGRSVAWTSDGAGLWTRAFLRSADTNRFWSNMVSWTIPSAQANRLFVTTTRGQGDVRVGVDIPESLGTSPRVSAQVSSPGQRTSVVQLQPASPGRYTGAFSASQDGSYFVAVEARGRGHALTGQGGIDVPFPDEYRSTGTNAGVLSAIAQAGGGSVLSTPREVWSDNLAAVYDAQSLTQPLWLLALLLLPIDVALRRLIVSRRDLEALRSAVRFPKRVDAA